MTLLHELPDFADLVAVVARNEGVDPGLVEKDYWIMHCHGGFSRPASCLSSKAELHFPRASS